AINAKRHILTRKEQQRRIAGLSFIIGGDDRDPTTLKHIIFKGLKGTEYIFESGVPRGISARGRVLDAGDWVYVIHIRSLTLENLTSDPADRFLNSIKIK
ncbi:MAG: hypothetical protein ABIV21_00345, partial [Pyrinomonadaceae bacterium]